MDAGASVPTVAANALFLELSGGTGRQPQTLLCRPPLFVLLWCSRDIFWPLSPSTCAASSRDSSQTPARGSGNRNSPGPLHISPRHQGSSCHCFVHPIPDSMVRASVRVQCVYAVSIGPESLLCLQTCRSGCRGSEMVHPSNNYALKLKMGLDTRAFTRDPILRRSQELVGHDGKLN